MLGTVLGVKDAELIIKQKKKKRFFFFLGKLYSEEGFSRVLLNKYDSKDTNERVLGGFVCLFLVFLFFAGSKIFVDGVTCERDLMEVKVNICTSSTMQQKFQKTVLLVFMSCLCNWN